MQFKTRGQKGSRAAAKGEDVPPVRESVIAILTSDWHLSDVPPIVRSAEPNWFAAMLRPVKEIRDLWHELKHPAIIHAGDLFDRHNPTPRLINWALENIPPMFCIPGQHDLKHHNQEDIKDTAYWTLVEAERIEHLDRPRPVNAVTIHPFSWGSEVAGPRAKSSGFAIAVIHKYVWWNKHRHQKARPESDVENFKQLVEDYDAVVIGDNHKGWHYCTGRYNILNCGTLMRRKADEINYQPWIGLLHSDGSITTQLLDCSEDKFIDVDAAASLVEQGLDMTEFVNELRKLGDKALDFIEAVKQFCADNRIDRGVVKVILKALESK